MNFDNRVALITGAGSEKGIGKETAKQLSKRGATVILADINEEGLELAVQDLKSTGGKAHSVKLDVTNKAQIDKSISQLIEKFGKIDILVNNAGISRPTRVIDIEEKEWDLVFDINMKGVF